jgi:hypothetical protein
MKVEDVVKRWTELDRESATGRPDRDAIDATAAAREALIERVMSGQEDVDLLHAAAMLGRLLAAHGCSPSLAAATIDGAVRALEIAKGRWAALARSALTEAYVAARDEQSQLGIAKSWSFPACCVPLAAGEVAVAAGIPSDDSDEIVAWADGVARALARMKVRRAIVSGKGAALAALEDALSLVGIATERSPGFGVT